MIRGIIGLVVLCSGFIQAQDVHYSQFDKTTSLLNPSLIANQNEDYEIQLQRRSQWSSVTTPFNTFSASFNARDIYKSLSSGVTILNDVAGDSYFSTNGISFSVAKSLKINKNLFSFGAQASLYQRSINYDGLVFLQNEQFDITNFSFFDFGLGVSNYKRVGIKSALLLGLSSFHLNRPNQSLGLNDKVFLSPKHLIHVSYYHMINSKIDITPTAYASLQNHDSEFIIGSGVTYKINNKFNLISGVYSRIKDAIFITIGMKNKNLSAVFSYDINISSLASASNWMGGSEFSIIYKWSVYKQKNEKKTKICPKYL